MKFRTFLSTYLLFVLIFFIGMGIVSVYMTDSQLMMLKEKSKSEYKTIAAAVTKDLAVLKGRLNDPQSFKESAAGLIDNYKHYYIKNGITLELEDLPGDNIETELIIITENDKDFINISGKLTGSYWNYLLSYSNDVTENILELKNIQETLLLLSVSISLITALALYAILSGIFKPLAIVSKTSRKISKGHYSERIEVKGSNELSGVAEDFNSMAAEIEKQMGILEEEAIQKQRFADNFAHEIRTPLTSIHGFAEYLLTANLNEEEIIESAEFILTESSYMRKISDSLLELATLRNCKAEKASVSLKELFDGVVNSLKKLADGKGIKIICDIKAKKIRGQEDLLRSLLLNLGFNAIKACAENSGIIRFEAMEDGNAMIISVADNGCGIPEESLPFVEEPFYRADKARSRESGGAGLGLSLCKQIVSAHGAKMRIESKPDKGTKVAVVFTTP